MLASALLKEWRARGWEAVQLSRSEVDVTNAQAVESALTAARPKLVLHAAALTKVNYCEEHPQEAFTVNRDGTANVARAAAAIGARLVYFSTDYVFDGSQTNPWLESDPTGPLNVYGASKLAGEEAARLCPNSCVVRISGVFGARADGTERNFVRAITEQLAAGAAPQVVADQGIALSYAPHIAAMLAELLDELPPLLHLTSAGADSWFGWARQVATALGADLERIRPKTSDPASLVQRPTNSVLGTIHLAAARLSAANPAAAGIREYVESLRGRDTGIR